MNKQGFIVPAEVLLRVLPDIKNNVQFVMFFTNEMYFLRQDFNRPELFKGNNANYIFFDDKNVIHGISESMEKQKFFASEFIANLTSKSNVVNYYVTDVFPELDTDDSTRKKFFNLEPLMLWANNMSSIDQ